MKDNISLGTTVFSNFALYLTITTSVYVFLREQSTRHILGVFFVCFIFFFWVLVVETLAFPCCLKRELALPAILAFPAGLPDFTEFSSSALTVSYMPVHPSTALWAVSSFHSSQQQNSEEL